MIRRTEKDAYWLISQHDHALLSGELAKHLGNAQFAKPDPYESTLLAIAQHDCGWPLHDEHPTRSAAKLPLDVFETPRQIAHPVWINSARKAAAMDPYAGLLVSLHVLALSAASVSTNQPSRFDIQQMRQQFDLNKIQHQAIELLENLRKKLGLHIDKPLRLGLAEGWTSEAEEKLKHNFRLLQAMDVMSLAICCTKPPETMTGQVHPRPGLTGIKLQLHRPTTDQLLVKQWPFDVDQFEVSVPYRIVPQRTYASDEELRVVYASAPTDQLRVLVRSA